MREEKSSAIRIPFLNRKIHRKALACVLALSVLIGAIPGYNFSKADEADKTETANIPSYAVGSTFQYKDRIGSSLPLNDSRYGNWTGGSDQPETKISSGASRTYVSLSKGSNAKTALLGKQFDVSSYQKGIYSECNVNFPDAGGEKSNYDFSLGLANAKIDGQSPVKIHVSGTGTVFSYTNGDKQETAQYLSGKPITADPAKWYTFCIFVDPASNPETYSLTIRENGSVIFSKQGISLAAKPDGKAEYLVFQNGNANPVNIDNAVLCDGMAYGQDFESSGTDSLKNWTSSVPDNVDFQVKQDSEHGNYMEIANPANGQSFSPAYTFLNNGYGLTSEQTVVEFDAKASAGSGSRRILFYDSNSVDNSVRAEFEGSGFDVLTVGKATVQVVPQGQFDADSWHHLKFVLRQEADCYDVYVDNSPTPAVSGVTFYSASGGVGITNSSCLNTGKIVIQSDAGSGTLDLDNFKVYKENVSLSSETALSKLSDTLKNSNDKNAKIEALYQIRQACAGQDGVLPAVVSGTGDDYLSVRSAAVTVLGCFGRESNDGLDEMCLSDNYFTRDAVINQLCRNGVSKADIAKAIEQKYLVGQDQSKQRLAVMALGHLKTSAASTAPNLLRIIRNGANNMDLRLQALNSMWYVAEDRLTPSDWAIALSDNGEKFYQLMNKAEEKLADDKGSALTALRSEMKSASEQTRTRAVSVIEKIAPYDSNAKTDLTSALSDKAWCVQWEAAQALQKLGDSSDRVKQILNTQTGSGSSDSSVKVTQNNGIVTIDNGVVTIQAGCDPKGKQFASLFHLSFDSDGVNLLSSQGEYQNIAGSNAGAVKSATTKSKEFQLVKNTADMAEIAFKFYASKSAPFDEEQHYVLRKGDSGYYFYTVIKKSDAYPDGQLSYIDSNIRINPNLFNYRICSMDLQGQLITSAALAKIHDNQIMNETYRMSDGNVWAKYAWESYNKQPETYGACGDNTGIWLCEPARDSGGNYPQWSMGTVHETLSEPVILCNTDWSVWASQSFPIPVNKINGPYFVYANKGSSHSEMYVDAQKKTEELKSQWPFNWMTGTTDVSYSTQRGTVTGKLTVASNSSKDYDMAKNAHIILCYPDEDDNERWGLAYGPHYYQVQTDKNGNFTIPKVAADTYTLYAFVDGVYGEIRKDNVTVGTNKANNLGTLELKPKTNGNLVWQIGTPDRSGKEFLGGSDVRNYDEFLRYREFFPNDVDYTVGKSDPSKDWFFIQPAQASDGTNPVWKIHFYLNEVPKGQAILTFGIATSRDTTLNVSVNDTALSSIPFPYVDEGGAVIRGSLYGYPRQRVLKFDSSVLKKGENTITLQQPANGYWLQYVGYDFIRLETSSTSSQTDLFKDIKVQWAKAGQNQGGSYNSGTDVTRGELCALVCKAIGFTPGRYLGCYSDVNAGSWYAGAVQALYNKQILTGAGTAFKPDDPVTREDAAKILMSAYKYRLSKLPGYDMSKVSDSKSVGSKSLSYVRAALGSGIMSLESGNKFDPSGIISRKDMLDMVQKLNEAYPGLSD